MRAKIPALAFIVLLLAAPVMAGYEIRTWTDTQGRTVQGKFAEATPTEVIVIEADGSKAHLPRAVLSPLDLDYADIAMASRPINLKVEATQLTFSSQSSETLDGTVKKSLRLDERRGYDIHLENRSAFDGQNLRVEYCLYLQQAADHGQIDGSSQLAAIAASGPPQPVGPEPPLTLINGTAIIDTLHGNGAFAARTAPVDVVRIDAIPPYRWSKFDPDNSVTSTDELKGIWVRVWQGGAVIAEYASSESYLKAGWGRMPPKPAGSDSAVPRDLPDANLPPPARPADVAEMMHSKAAAGFAAGFAADTGIELVPIPPGSFLMGFKIGFGERSDLFYLSSEANRPQTRVTFSDGFFLGATDVTQAEWTDAMGRNPSFFKGDMLPVETVSWDDAMAFCRKLNEREQAAGRLPPGWQFTLPTEAQWEYACLAGTANEFPAPANDHDDNYQVDFGGVLGALGWNRTNSGGTTHPVAQKPPNAWGLYDMHGDVWEWCSDWYGPYPGVGVVDPTGPATGIFRVARGGGWASDASRSRAAVRSSRPPGFRYSGIGFRLVFSRVAPTVAAGQTERPSVAAAPAPPAAAAVPIPVPPLAAAQAAALPEKFAPIVAGFAAATGISLVPIPAGSFAMGSPDKEAGRRADEGPSTFVTLSKGFFLGATVVTQGQFEAAMGYNPSRFKIAGPDAPVEQVTWDDAMTFCRKLTERERTAGRLPEGLECTLPTEAQWEYACRAGTTGPFPGKADAMAWKGAKGDPTHPVGRLQPNAWGLYDLAGEVRQYCLDFNFFIGGIANRRPIDHGAYTGGVVSDPIGFPEGYDATIYSRLMSVSPPTIAHVVRGSPAWPLDARSAARFAVAAPDANPETGFRVALVQVEARRQPPAAAGKRPAGPEANAGK